MNYVETRQYSPIILTNCTTYVEQNNTLTLFLSLYTHTPHMKKITNSTEGKRGEQMKRIKTTNNSNM